MYNGRLGRIRLDDYILPLRADYKPMHTKPYAPRGQEGAAYDEIQRLLELGVIEQIYVSEAAAPAFFLTKPSGALRLLVDFRALNQYFRRSPYYIPKIREILIRLGKAKCMNTLDANIRSSLLCIWTVLSSFRITPWIIWNTCALFSSACANTTSP